MHSRRVSTASNRTRGPTALHPSPPVPGGWPQGGYSLPVPQPHPHAMEGWSAPFPAPMPLPDYQQHHLPAPVSTRSTSMRHSHPLHEINKQQAAPYRHGGASPTGRSYGLDSCKKEAPPSKVEVLRNSARDGFAPQVPPSNRTHLEEQASCENNCSDDSYGCEEVGHEECDVFPEGCEDAENKEKRLLCQFFLRTGTCAFGNRCKYFHPRNHKPPQLNLLGYPLRPGDKSCSFYMKTGWCAFGATCKFHHPPPENQPPSAKASKNQPPPPRVDMRMPHPPAPYPPGPPMGVMNGTWPMVPPNLWYHPAVHSAPMMPMPPPMPAGAMMRHVPPVQPWKANKSCKDVERSYHSSGRSSRTSFERRRSSEGDRTSSSSDDTHTEMEHAYGAMAGHWDARVQTWC
ncbi:hypothetical protein BSKO_14071 [Bryopsis sp. KO-2023]|nr:hypothetical protein BSKO_14071 [Bryopsis sp. KO-2023]